MKKVAIGLSCLLLCLTGCNAPEEEKAAGGGGGGGNGKIPSNSIFKVNKANVNDPYSLIGLWESQEEYDFEGNSSIMRLLLHKRKITAARKCSFRNGVQIVAEVSAKVNYSNGQYEIASSEGDTEIFEKDNDIYQCDVDIPKRTFIEPMMAPQLSIGEFTFIKVGN